ncbi:uncharacterized protein [Typha angustifolia]
MPYGHGMASNIEKIADRRSHTMFKSSRDQSNSRFCSKDHEASEVISGNSEERCLIFPFFALELDSYWKLAPFLSPLGGDDRRNYLISGANMDGLVSSSPQPTIIFQIDLPSEQKTGALEQTDSSKSFSECSSFVGHDSMLERKKWANSVNDSSSIYIASGLVLDKSSISHCESQTVGSDFIGSDIRRADKTVKGSPRKKGKKKGKRHKRAMHKKASVGLEIQCEASTGDASFVISDGDDKTCSSKHLADKLSEQASSPRYPLKEIHMEKVDSDNNYEYVDCSTSLMSSTSYSDDTDDSGPTASSQATSGVRFSNNNTNNLNKASSAIQTSKEDLLKSSENHRNVHPRQKNKCYNNSSRRSMDNPGAAVEVQPFLDGWNSDTSKESNDDVEPQLAVKVESGHNCLECGIVTDLGSLKDSYMYTSVDPCSGCTKEPEDCYPSNHDRSKDVISDQNSTESTQYSSEACSSNDFCPVISGKRGSRARKLSGIVGLNEANRLGGTKIHGYAEKNDLSVWQKVQKFNNEELINKPSTSCTTCQDAITLKESRTRMRFDPSVRLKQNHSGKACDYPCFDEAVKTDLSKAANVAVNLTEISCRSSGTTQVSNVKTKPSSASKQSSHQSQKGSCTSNTSVLRADRNHILQKEGSQTLLSVNGTEQINRELMSSSVTLSQHSLLQSTESITNNQSEEKQMSRCDMGKMTSGNIGGLGCERLTQPSCNEAGVLIAQQDSHAHMPIKGSSFCISSEDPKKMTGDLFLTDGGKYQCATLEAENFLPECSKLDSKLDYGAGLIFQKWIPVGKNNSEVPDIGHSDSLKPSILENSNSDSCNCNDVEVEVLRSVDPCIVHCSSAGMLSSQHLFQHVDPSFREDALNYKGTNRPCSAKEFSCAQAAAKCQTHDLKCQHFLRSETDLDKIIEAVNDAYKVQVKVEGIHLVNGIPLADFERFIYSASPAIGYIPYIRSCQLCSPEQLIGDSLCWHQIPNSSLKSIWQWYEEPGCYGLEVKAQEYRNLKRLRTNYSEFSAYFVPYLSAVQLFRRSGSNRSGNLQDEAAGLDETSTSLSYLGSLPIFSMLLPHSCKQNDKLLPGSTFSTEDDQFCKRGDGELIFEYFESEQPPRRRPLFEKIKELISGVKPSSGQIFGDPQKLEYLNLRDLHPASWYCVAWYPIYRIPDGNFRAAFLTYHSLGHLVQRNDSRNMNGGLTHVVSPVVGLQTYNDKGEWWFRMKDLNSKPMMSEESLHINPSEVLKERLRTLNQTAVLMARAEIPKGSQMSANLHPDYEFFLSRCH